LSNTKYSATILSGHKILCLNHLLWQYKALTLSHIDTLLGKEDLFHLFPNH